MKEFLNELHVFLVKNKKLVLLPLQVSQVLLALLIAVAFYFSLGYKLNSGLMKEIGEKFGALAFLLYAFTLTPGILGRFKVFPSLRKVMIFFRSDVGVLTFLTAVLHEGLIFTFPMLSTGSLDLSVLGAHEVYGMIALLIFFPMWLTSSDFANRKMGKYWKPLHRFTYLALLFVFLHIATASESKLAFVAFAFIVAEVVSWIVHWSRPKEDLNKTQ